MRSSDAARWDASYRAERPPWEIDRPQPAVERLLDEDAFHGDVLDVGKARNEWSVSLRAEDAVDLVEIGIVQRELVDRFIGNRSRIKGLLVLAPSHIADERRVVINDLLAADSSGGVEALILEICLVELVGFGIEYRRVRWIERIGA